MIKYWGKRDNTLILPVSKRHDGLACPRSRAIHRRQVNSSLSVTLAQSDLCAQTSVRVLPASDGKARDRVWLNGEEVPLGSRLQAVLAAARALRRATPEATAGDGALADAAVHVVSRNNFPTAAGLASSAAGFACLAAALAHALRLWGAVSPERLSHVARVGSGSACRSLFGGFARWRRGEAADGSDSEASAVAAAAHWPSLRVLVLVVSDQKKEYSSTAGQETSVQTSALLAHRAAAVVEPRMAQMEAAIAARDFPAFAKLTMQDSNQFHAVRFSTCLFWVYSKSFFLFFFLCV